MDLRNKINEAIENGDFSTADILIQKLYETEFGNQEIECSNDFVNKVIASSKGEKIKMNNKLRKLIVAASCTLIIGVTGFTVNAATDGGVVNNVKTFIKNVGCVKVEAKQYKDVNGTHTEYEIYNLKVKQTEKNDGSVDVTIDNIDNSYTDDKTEESTIDNK